MFVKKLGKLITFWHSLANFRACWNLLISSTRLVNNNVLNISGRKSNKGVYEYKKGSKKREENPEAKKILERYKLQPKER